MVVHYDFNLHFLMISFVEHLFMYLLAIHMSSWVKCLFKLFLFPIFICVVCLLIELSYFDILDISPLSDTYFVNIISQSVAGLFICKAVS